MAKAKKSIGQFHIDFDPKKEAFHIQKFIEDEHRVPSLEKDMGFYRKLAKVRQPTLKTSEPIPDHLIKRIDANIRNVLRARRVGPERLFRDLLGRMEVSEETIDKIVQIVRADAMRRRTIATFKWHLFRGFD